MLYDIHLCCRTWQYLFILAADGVHYVTTQQFIYSTGGHWGCFQHFATTNNITALASVAQLVGASSCKLKGHEFSSQSGHMPGLQARPPVGVHERQPHIDILSFSFPSLPLCLKLNR